MGEDETSSKEVYTKVMVCAPESVFIAEINQPSTELKVSFIKRCKETFMFACKLV